MVDNQLQNMKAGVSKFMLCICSLALVLSGCAQTKSFTHGNLKQGDLQADTLLLMPPHVRLYELHASGATDLKANWSEKARKNVIKKLREKAKSFDAQITLYDTLNKPAKDIAAEHIQKFKLFHRVSASIKQHKYKRPYKLPTKEGKFDWRIGENLGALRQDYPQADYALFINFRDTFSTPGRVMLIATAAAFGVGIPGGQQLGSAALVDMSTGEIEWFNIMRSGVGDLRKPKGAKRATDAVLEDVPL